MATKIEELLEDAYDDVKADVVATIKAHPEYARFVNAMAAQGIKELFSLVGGAA
jgi:hypothetical protein